MSITINKKATIQWKLNPSFFKKVNQDNIIEPRRYLGSAKKAVDSMLAKGELLRDLMPNILGLDPNSNSSNWTEAVKNYWDSLTVIISPAGKQLNLSFTYSVDSNKPEVLKLVESKKIKSDQDLVDYVNGTKNGVRVVEEEDRFRYGTPESPEDYLLWLYTLNYRDVANVMEDANKSKDIRFYIEFEGDTEAIKRDLFVKTNKANELFIQLVKDESKLDNMIYMYDTNPSDFELPVDKQIFIRSKVESDPDTFIKLYEDKSLESKALIERLIKKGILNRLVNTQIIVDADDPEFVVGNTNHEALLFFKSDKPSNVAKVKEYQIKLKTLTN